MKKVLKIASVLFVLILVALIFLPYLFKDQIKAKVQTEISNHIDARVYFGDFGLTLIRNFPNITIQLENFGIVGNGVFARDTLVGVKQLNIVLDILSVFRGEQISVRKFILDEPRIHAIILPDGKANWDIYITDAEDTEAVQDTAPSEFNLELNEYAVKNAWIKYDDRQGKVFAQIHSLTHSGNGDFNQDKFILRTKTLAKGVNVKMEGTQYLRNLNLDARMDMDMDMVNNIYLFRDNKISLNDLHLKFDGFVQPAGDDLRMDITFNTLQTDFKNILSLVPGIYTESFRDIKTSGSLALGGFAKGTYNDKRMPAFGLNVKIHNAAFKYPDLPEEVRNINLDLDIQNSTGNVDDTGIELRQFHADFGNNPIDARASVQGLVQSKIDASIVARLNLEEMLNIFPMEGLIMKGTFDLKGNAKGTYSETSMPVVDAQMSLVNAYLKSEDFPSAIENLAFTASMNSDGSLPNTQLKVHNLHAEIDKEPIDMNMELTRFDDPHFVVNMKGSLDLDKLMKIYPIEKTELGGKMSFALSTKGKQSDVEAERYMNIPTSGNLQIQKLHYRSEDLPQGITIENGDFSFDPKEIKIIRYEGKAGSSAISLKGAFQNYLAYALLDNQPLSGKLNLSSPRFNVNEWLSEDAPGDMPAEEGSMSPVEVPAGISFVMNTDIKEVLYDNLVLKNLSGQILVKNQAVSMENVRFDLLEGSFVMGGTYSAVNIARPTFDFSMRIADLNIQQAYNAFNTVQILAPAAKFVEGKFNTEMRISSALGMDMMPLMETFTGIGNMLIANGKVTDMPIIQKLGEASKFIGGSKTFELNNTKINYRIENGKIFYDPFDVKAGNTLLNVSGSNSLDKSILYLVKIDAPSGVAGQAVNAATAGLTGGQKVVGDRIKMEVNLGGTFTNPKILSVKGGEGGSPQEQVKEAIQEKVEEYKDKAKEEADRLKKEAEAKARQEAERLKNEAEAKARQEADRLKKEAENKGREAADKLKRESEDKARQEAERLKQEAERKAREEAERKAKEEAEKKAKEEAEKLKNKIKFPK